MTSNLHKLLALISCTNLKIVYEKGVLGLL